MLTLATALFTAALALTGKVLFDLWGRCRERRGLAAALAGEIGAYVDLLDPPATAANYRAMGTLDREKRRACLRAIPTLPTTHPVFDKVADRLGLLPYAEAFGVSRIYNAVTGLRLVLAGMSSEPFLEADDDLQRNRIEFVAAALEREGRFARDLVRRLRCISGQGIWGYASDRDASHGESGRTAP